MVVCVGFVCLYFIFDFVHFELCFVVCCCWLCCFNKVTLEIEIKNQQQRNNNYKFFNYYIKIFLYVCVYVDRVILALINREVFYNCGFGFFALFLLVGGGARYFCCNSSSCKSSTSSSVAQVAEVVAWQW